MTNSNDRFYLCPICFAVCESEIACRAHNHRMIWCDPIGLTDEQRKPLMYADGRLASRAPRWFLEAVGALPARYSPQTRRGYGVTP
jgi:hypothetical protein